MHLKIIETFHKHAIVKPDGCWEWAGSKFSNGYGSIRLFGLNLLAHKVSYIIHIGEIPMEHIVHHKCENPGCVNPNHLEVLTHLEHRRLHREADHSGRDPMAYGTFRRNKTFCKYGHPFDAENTYHRKDGTRTCRICVRRRNHKY